MLVDTPHPHSPTPIVPASMSPSASIDALGGSGPGGLTAPGSPEGHPIAPATGFADTDGATVAGSRSVTSSFANRDAQATPTARHGRGRRARLPRRALPQAPYRRFHGFPSLRPACSSIPDWNDRGSRRAQRRGLRARKLRPAARPEPRRGGLRGRRLVAGPGQAPAGCGRRGVRDLDLRRRGDARERADAPGSSPTRASSRARGRHDRGAARDRPRMPTAAVDERDHVAVAASRRRSSRRGP